MKAAEWLISQNPVLLGSDNWPVEVAPNPDPQISLPVHQIALVVNGVHLLENLKLDELVAKNVQEFAFIMTPLKIRGATGSTVSPIRGVESRLLSRMSPARSRPLYAIPPRWARPNS